jgi:2-polyprenyl-3-methyl-5-hydroxy-6-metoxy-1,4-benzoquinol methylase
MKNILAEKPAEKLHGRLLASVNFVSQDDLINKEVLDIGCGYGWCELNFLERGIKKIAATEIAENDLQTIKQGITDSRLATIRADACELPFPSGTFDTVVAWEVIEHIYPKTEAVMFEEVFRVLRSGGSFYLSTPSSSFFTNFLDPAWYFGHRHYSLKKLCDLGLNKNFKVIESKIVGTWWTLVSIVNLYFSKWILRRKRIFNGFFNNKEDKEFSKKGFANIFIKFKKA